MLWRGSVYLVSILRKEHLPISFQGATPTLLLPSHFPATSEPPSELDPCFRGAAPFAAGGQAFRDWVRCHQPGDLPAYFSL